MTVRHPPLAPMSPFEDEMGSNAHKVKSLLLENYKNMYSKMHEMTAEKRRIGKMIEELTKSLMNTDVYIKNFK